MLKETLVDTQTIATGLDTPWEMVWGPDDHIWITERFGRISRIDPLSGMQDVVLDLSQTVEQTGESGMLGLALHPDFPDDNRVYVVYTYLEEEEIVERLVAYHYRLSKLKDPEILIDGIQGNNTHNGSRLLFGPDKKLYMTTGDAQNQPAAQDASSLNGKTLRINADGTVPADNPIAGSYVFTSGHRNAQGLCIGPNEWLYSSEHGASSDDELNNLAVGKNYGWPNIRGYCDTPAEEDACGTLNATEPIHAWTPTLAVSDLEYYNSSVIPELEGALLMVTLKEKDLRAIFLATDGAQIEREEIYFDGEWNRLRALCVAPDGSIYISNSRSNWGNSSTSFNHQIVRIFNAKAQGSLENPDAPNIEVFPNPFRRNFYIKAPSYLQDATYSLTSSTGSMLFSGTRKDMMTYLNSEQVRGGTYFLSATFETITWRRQIVKSEN